MPKREPSLLVQDMLTAAERIGRYTRDLDHRSFLGNDIVIDAVVRNLEVLGEAARQLPEEFIQRHPEIQWRLIGGLRNRIVHGYFGIDLDIIWQIVHSDLPALKTRLENIKV